MVYEIITKGNKTTRIIKNRGKNKKKRKQEKVNAERKHNEDDLRRMLRG